MTEPTRFEPRADPRPDDAAWPDASWPPPADTVLTGTTVELRPTVIDDTLDLFVALDDTRVWEHLRNEQPYKQDVMRAIVADRIATTFTWTVRDVRTRAVLGWSGYFETSVEHARTEIGGTQYTVDAWGTRVNPECKLLLFGYAFDVLGMGRVQLKTDVRNVRSQQAMARLGASYEGVLRRHQRRQDGSMRDSVLFSVIAEEWPDVRARLEERLALGSAG